MTKISIIQNFATRMEVLVVRVTLELQSKFANHGVLVLPYHHIDWVQAAIYQSMQHSVATAVHDVGFPVDNRAYRLFTFSRIQGRFRALKETIEFTFPIKIVIASPIKLLVQQFVNALINEGEFHIGPETCRLSTVSVDDTEVQSTRVRVRTLSPLTVHSTLTKPDGHSYTVYYHPKEHNFEEQMLQNLLRKYVAVTGTPLTLAKDTPPFRIRPRNESKMHIVKYKKIIIKGYSGVFDIEGPRDLLKIGWDAGFGDRNSQGFGLVEMGNRQ